MVRDARNQQIPTAEVRNGAGDSALVLTGSVRSVAPEGRCAAAKEGVVEERDGTAIVHYPVICIESNGTA
jgi:hypothetical protein